MTHQLHNPAWPLRQVGPLCSLMPGEVRPQPRCGHFAYYGEAGALGETIDLDARLTATQAAQYAGVTVQAIVNWRNRGHLERGPDGKYKLLDVAKALHGRRHRPRRRP